MRLQKWYEAKEVQEKKKIVRELTSTILSRLIILFDIFVFEIKDLGVIHLKPVTNDFKAV